MSALEIGIVCFSSLGGSGTVAVELAHALELRGHRVTVLAEGRPQRLHPSTPFTPIASVEHPLFTDAPRSLALASTLVRASRGRPLDLIHFHYAVPHAASAVLVQHALGAAAPAMVTTLHGTDVTALGGDDAYGPVLGPCLRAHDALTTPSHFLRGVASAVLDVSPEVVPNFVDPSVFRPEAADRARVERVFQGAPPAGLTLVHVSNFRPVKATHTLVPLMQRLARTVPGGARMLLVGEGPERARVEADARAAGLAASMRFAEPGGDPHELAALVAACDLFVFPSELESFGLAALEALACGVPVVARNVGGLPEVIRDRVTGRLVDEPGELAEAIESMLAPEIRRAMSAAAIDDARRRFAPAAIATAYEAVYSRALEKKRARSR